MFYVNLQRQDGIIIFELHKMKFFLTIEEFKIICNLSFSGTLFTCEALSEVENFDFLSSAQSLLVNPSKRHIFPLTVELMTMNCCLIHYMTINVLILKKFNQGNCQRPML